MPDLQRCLTIEDLRQAARRRVPRMFFEYADHGGFWEQTYRENSSDFDAIKLRQRIAVDMSDRSLETTLLGAPVNLPVVLGPVGSLGMQSADGEIKAARAAHEYGVPYALSMMSICSVEDLAEHFGQPFWLQLYLTRDESYIERLIERARAARVSALILTMDRQVQGERHNERRNGLSSPPKFIPRHIWQVLTRPRWAFEMARTRRRSFRNVMGHVAGAETLKGLAGWGDRQFDIPLSWRHVEWVKKLWGGRIIVKGLLDAEDARLAVAHGVDAVVVSNHGGRQLENVASTIRILPEIVDAVAGRCEVHLDGGIRSGQAVLKALALGAQGVWLGRAQVYGLAAGGEAGVIRALEIIARELDITMALCGERDVRNLGPHNIYANDLLREQAGEEAP